MTTGLLYKRRYVSNVNFFQKWDTAYDELAGKTARLFKNSYEDPKISEPIVIADTILTAITLKNLKTRYVAGYMDKTYLFFRKILPDKMFDKILSSALK